MVLSCATRPRQQANGARQLEKFHNLVLLGSLRRSKKAAGQLAVMIWTWQWTQMLRSALCDFPDHIFGIIYMNMRAPEAQKVRGEHQNSTRSPRGKFRRSISSFRDFFGHIDQTPLFQHQQTAKLRGPCMYRLLARV